MRWIGGAVVALVSALAARAELDARDYHTRRSILAPEISAAGLLYLPLDDDALRQDSESQFRIVSAGNREVPYRLIRCDGQTLAFPVPSKVVRQSAAVLVQTLDPIVTPRTRVDLAWSAGSRVRELIVESEGAVRQRVRPVLGEPPTTLVFPSTPARTLRLRWTAVSGKRASLEGADVWSETPIPRRLIPVSAQVASVPAPSGRSLWRLDLRDRVMGLAKLAWEIDEPSFDRGLSVSLGDGVGWEDIHVGRLRRVAGAEPAVVDLGDRSGRTIQVQIVHGDDAPLTAHGFRVWRYERGLIFPVQPGQRYALWYGRAHAPSADYDLARLPLTRSLESLPVAHLGPVVARPAAAPPPPVPWTRRYPWALWIALAGVVGLLAATIRRSVKAPPER